MDNNSNIKCNNARQNVANEGENCIHQWLNEFQPLPGNPVLLAKPENPITEGWNPIGSLKIDHENQMWKLDNCVKSDKVYGMNDWAYKHNRLLDPGNCGHSFVFSVPENATSVRILCKYFGPWNMDPIFVNLSVNGICLKERSLVEGEHRGRTTDEIVVQKWKPNGNEFSLEFVEGDGVLFLWQYIVEAQF